MRLILAAVNAIVWERTKDCFANLSKQFSNYCCEREISKEKGAMYRVVAPIVFLQRSELVEAA